MITITIGIYKITNKVNKKVYIGQSVNIETRYYDHCRSGQPEKYAFKNERDINTPIHRAMQKYGVENFELSILKKCQREELDNYEKYYIKKYNSCVNGYNILEGGQKGCSLSGELHSQAKLSKEDALKIIDLLKNTDKSYDEISSMFTISKAEVSNINTGKNWIIDNIYYPIRVANFTSRGRRKLSDEQVMAYRDRLLKGEKKSHLVKELVEKIGIGSSSAYNLLNNKTFTHLL